MTSHLRSLPQVQLAGGGEVAPGAIVQAIPAEVPAPPTKLSAREKKLWNYITTALVEYGLIHRTDGMLLTVICRTFIRWVEAEEALTDVIAENGGSYMVETPNGYAQPHQVFYVARQYKKELLQWLPEAALTIPAFAKAVDERQAPVQGTLFEDPVQLHQNRHPVPMRAV